MIFPQTPRWILKFLLILMSTYHNKSNYNVKESPEQNLIEMSISNGEYDVKHLKGFLSPLSKQNETLSEL